MSDKPAFKLYNQLSRQVEPLQTIEPGHLKFYCCGPTVYSYAHIGNFRTFITADLVVRTAQALGMRVTYVSNITDVGHLTQDDVADAGGEDKMAKALKSKEGEAFSNVWELADHYSRSFERDCERLNLLPPTVRPKATQHMMEQIRAVEDLVRTGHAYEAPTGVYFSVESFADYGKLSGNRDQENLQRGVRQVVKDPNKRHPADFALWKKDDKHLMQWYSPWGWGFPGWHIECSVMAAKYLGDTFDLHAGGEDLIFPHHECEIAQSESLTGKPLCNHWMHVRFLQVEGEKMSKSAGNFYTVRDLVDDEGVDPLALRYALMTVPYGKPLNFTRQTLRDAEGNVRRFKECQKRIKAVIGDLAGTGEPTPALTRIYGEALAAMADDLNTSVAIAKALEGTKEILRPAELTEEEAHGGLWFLHQIEALLGIVGPLQEAELPAGELADPEWEGRPISDWIAERAEAKQAKNFARADEIRNGLLEAGYRLIDTPQGTEWERV